MSTSLKTSCNHSSKSKSLSQLFYDHKYVAIRRHDVDTASWLRHTACRGGVSVSSTVPFTDIVPLYDCATCLTSTELAMASLISWTAPSTWPHNCSISHARLSYQRQTCSRLNSTPLHTTTWTLLTDKAT